MFFSKEAKNELSKELMAYRNGKFYTDDIIKWIEENIDSDGSLKKEPKIKKFSCKVFCGNILPEETPEIIIQATSKEEAEKKALSYVAEKNLKYFEFVEAMEI